MMKGLGFVIFSVMLLCAVSACTPDTNDDHKCFPSQTSEVSGVIYQGELSNVVAKADVTVTCAHATQECKWVKVKDKWVQECTNVTKYFTEKAKSGKDGTYKVYFDTKKECSVGEEITVTAQKKDLTGENSGEITTETIKTPWGCVTLNVGIVNVPLVPEFGAIAGVVTILSAITVFFVVRRK